MALWRFLVSELSLEPPHPFYLHFSHTPSPWGSLGDSTLCSCRKCGCPPSRSTVSHWASVPCSADCLPLSPRPSQAQVSLCLVQGFISESFGVSLTLCQGKSSEVLISHCVCASYGGRYSMGRNIGQCVRHLSPECQVPRNITTETVYICCSVVPVCGCEQSGLPSRARDT